MQNFAMPSVFFKKLCLILLRFVLELITTVLTLFAFCYLFPFYNQQQFRLIY